MTVLRVTPNLEAARPDESRAFWEDVFGLAPAMDLGWIVIFGNPGGPQVTVAREGGSGTALPALSVEVDDLDGALDAARAGGYEVVYGPAEEPWGVRRFFVRAPSGQIVNVLSHSA
jgi:catechol 2,3-dioxygenase-like lactoylglutathione lyase family enzyme